MYIAIFRKQFNTVYSLKHESSINWLGLGLDIGYGLELGLGLWNPNRLVELFFSGKSLIDSYADSISKYALS